MSGKLKPSKIKDLDWNTNSRIRSFNLLEHWTGEDIDEILETSFRSGNAIALITIRQHYAEHFRNNKENVEKTITEQPGNDN